MNTPGALLPPCADSSGLQDMAAGLGAYPDSLPPAPPPALVARHDAQGGPSDRVRAFHHVQAARLRGPADHVHVRVSWRSTGEHHPHRAGEPSDIPGCVERLVACEPGVVINTPPEMFETPLPPPPHVCCACTSFLHCVKMLRATSSDNTFLSNVREVPGLITMHCARPLFVRVSRCVYAGGYGSRRMKQDSKRMKKCFDSGIFRPSNWRWRNGGLVFVGPSNHRPSLFDSVVPAPMMDTPGAREETSSPLALACHVPLVGGASPRGALSGASREALLRGVEEGALVFLAPLLAADPVARTPA